MKGIILTIVFSTSCFFSLLGQNFIYKGDQQYEATRSWRFRMNGEYWTGDPVFTVAKHSNGGYLMISINVPYSSHYIAGTVMVFLNDGSVIKCTDRGIRDHVDNRSIALYNFTSAEVERLKTHRIVRIRFSIQDEVFGLEAFTADNENLILAFPGSQGLNYYETDVEISELFQ